MNILGINFGHDASVALIRKGKILMAIEEEKISRHKQDFGWPVKSIESVLLQCELKASEIDVVAVGGMTHINLSPFEIKYCFTKNNYHKKIEYLSRFFSFVGINNNRFSEKSSKVFKAEVRQRGFINASVSFYNHHLCHAASAAYCAPFDPHLVVTCDGQGDGESFNFYSFSRESGLTPLEVNSYEVSPGQFYSCITQMLGYRPTRHEGKITGLAAYGKPSPLLNEFRRLYRQEKGRLTRYPFEKTDEAWEKSKLASSLPLSKKINIRTSESEDGLNYAKRAYLLLDKFKKITRGYSKEDIAFACQKVTEEVIISQIQRVLDDHFSNRKVSIGLGGGVFANVRINQMVFEIPNVQNVFVQPAMGDSGLALGAAVLEDISQNKRLNDTDYRFTNTFLGPDFKNRIPAFLKTLKDDVIIEQMEEPARRIAQLLKDNHVIGFWSGSMEWGPRALGRRSMLVNTFNRKINDSVNRRLNRTEFMPFAPVILDYKIKEYIPSYDPSCPAANYMTITYDVDPKFHDELQAVVHVDGTARPQVITREIHPYYYDILDEFCKLTGCGALVNTSFNAHEEPIVSTPEVAFKALLEDRIDMLVLENYLITLKQS